MIETLNRAKWDDSRKFPTRVQCYSISLSYCRHCTVRNESTHGSSEHVSSAMSKSLIDRHYRIINRANSNLPRYPKTHVHMSKSQPVRILKHSFCQANSQSVRRIDVSQSFDQSVHKYWISVSSPDTVCVSQSFDQSVSTEYSISQSVTQSFRH